MAAAVVIRAPVVELGKDVVTEGGLDALPFHHKTATEKGFILKNL